MTIKSAVKNKVLVDDLGLIEYLKAWDYQKKCVDRVLADKKERIILCEHPNVLTLGRLTKKENILADSVLLKGKNVSVVSVDRGGDVTLHAPGQLIAYPIFNLENYGKDLHAYLHKLEQVVIDFLKEFDIVANRSDLNTGAWVANKKIASIGIGVKRWVSYHGIGINVNTDLSLFSLIRPCGLDTGMTSMSFIRNKRIDMSEVKQKLLSSFEHHFGIILKYKGV